MKLEKRHFIAIMDSNKGIISSLCRLYYASIEDQKDAFQDIILQLWKSFATFRGESEISTWIYSVSLKTLLNKVRKDKRSVSIEPLAQSHFYIANAKADDNVSLLSTIMQSLKDTDKAILVLYLEGYRSKEIAAMLRLSPTNVTTRFNRLKSQLKLKFNKKSHEIR